MLVEQCAYANRWRSVSPAAKGLFALGGFVAAFVAGRPEAAFAVAALIVLATLAGAGIAAARSCAALAALLFLALTTPMIALIAPLRRLQAPEVLLEIMVLCYRMLFVFSEATRDTRTAQAARLGHASLLLTLRSLAGLAAHLTVQIWQRAHALHVAAQSRNNDGPLRFLSPEFAHAGRDLACAAAGGSALILLAIATP